MANPTQGVASQAHRMAQESPIKKGKKQSPSLFHTLKHGLTDYYLEPQPPVFKQFRNGLIYFGVGLMTIIMANLYLLPSLTRELVTLAGLLFIAVGFFIAMMAHMRLLIGRFVRFLMNKHS